MSASTPAQNSISKKRFHSKGLVRSIGQRIGVDLYTFVGARAPTMLSWAPPRVLWAPTTKVGTGITVTVR